MLNAYESYLENTILAADPLELVAILYRGAQEAVIRARDAVRSGDIAKRSKEITRASEILNELALSLDHDNGGNYSKQLVELYDYMQRRLIDANMRQVEGPLIEVVGLLATLREGWDSARQTLEPPAQLLHVRAASPYGGETEMEYSGLSFTA